MLVKHGKKSRSRWVTILWAGLVVGTFDAVAAIVSNYNVKAELIFRFIASGAFGKPAFTGGPQMIIWGIAFHYFIAYIFTAIFFFTYSLFYTTFKNKYIIGLEYGIICWSVMNLLVVPISLIGLKPFHLMSILTGMAILIACIGLPVAIIADRYYKKK